MYIVPALLFGFFASLFYVPDFLGTPFQELGLGEVIEQLLFCAFGLIALASLARSIEHDAFWPWHRGARELYDRWFHHHH